MAIKIRHFGIVVGDIEKSLHFYKDLLGFKIQRDMLEEGEFIAEVRRIVASNLRVKTLPTTYNLNGMPAACVQEIVDWLSMQASEGL